MLHKICSWFQFWSVINLIIFLIFLTGLSIYKWKPIIVIYAWTFLNSPRSNVSISFQLFSLYFSTFIFIKANFSNFYANLEVVLCLHDSLKSQRNKVQICFHFSFIVHEVERIVYFRSSKEKFLFTIFIMKY